jgi:hypothetical protein
LVEELSLGYWVRQIFSGWTLSWDADRWYLERRDVGDQSQVCDPFVFFCFVNGFLRVWLSDVPMAPPGFYPTAIRWGTKNEYNFSNFVLSEYVRGRTLLRLCGGRTVIK